MINDIYYAFVFNHMFNFKYVIQWISQQEKQLQVLFSVLQ